MSYPIYPEEKQERISNILEIAGKDLTRQLFLYNELLVLGATEEQKQIFSRKVAEAEAIYCQQYYNQLNDLTLKEIE